MYWTQSHKKISLVKSLREIEMVIMTREDS